jgi:hypothetical protein
VAAPELLVRGFATGGRRNGDDAAAPSYGISNPYTSPANCYCDLTSDAHSCVDADTCSNSPARADGDA